MKRSKKIFVAIGILFIIGVCIITVDIFTRTAPPGSKKYLKESLMPSDNEKPVEADTAEIKNSGQQK